MTEPRFTDTFDSFCPMCKQPMLQANGHRRSHKQGMAEVAFVVCDDCKDRSLCPQSFYGVHGEMKDLTDAMEPWEVPEADLKVFINAGIDVSSVPRSARGRIAYCDLCKTIQIWDVPTQRWRDWLGEEVPNERCPPLPSLR